MNTLTVPIEHALVLASVLFVLGLVGVMVRRNVIFMLMSLEIMMNACGFAFIAAGARWGQPDGQIMYMLVLSLAAAEVAVGLGLVLQLERRFGTLDIDAARSLRDGNGGDA
ncbi:MAG: NADH-quinone oxidoreductase subunit NuoK [Pseudomonadales bacterium]|jgi:NADH-quinone oxidoreductase subunit K|nr:NADH-quinone oxidoreductase subunit NuoK [Pseudomonadales bacterium]